MNKVVNDQKHPYFEVGQWYDFLYKNKLKLPDGSASMVLTDSKGVMYLVPITLYETYGFEPGQTIACKVDKINCTGKVFLEPKHPKYTEGEVYTFKRVGVNEGENESGDRIKRLIVEDETGTTFEFELLSDQHETGIPDELQCRVRRIRKSKVYLHWIAEDNQADIDYEVGKLYDFSVIKTGHTFKNQAFIVLRGLEGKLHGIKEKHYSSYNLQVGSIIQCEFRGYNESDRLLLEPVHPVYIPGKQYSFSVQFEKVDQVHHVLLIDVFGNQIDMGSVTDNEVSSFPETVMAEVTYIKKGIPHLKIDQGV
jgi:hypothetical protein